MGKLLYILYALAVSLTMTVYNIKGGSDGQPSHRWGSSRSGFSSGDWYSGGHHK